MHDVVIRLAEISMTVIYFSPCYSDPKYLGGLGRFDVFLVSRRLFKSLSYLGKAISYFLPVRILFKLNHEIAPFRPIFDFLASDGHRIP
jgi:hypothetical protein